MASFDGPRKCLLDNQVDKAVDTVIRGKNVPQEVLDALTSALKMIQNGLKA